MRESKSESESESERDEKSRVYYLIPFVEKLSFAFCDNLAEAFLLSEVISLKLFLLTSLSNMSMASFMSLSMLYATWESIEKMER